MPRSVESLPPPSLQESILAVLLFDETKSGTLVANQVPTASIFDESYREVAEKALDYRRRYKRPPGRAHLDDLFGKLLQPGRAPRLRRLVFDLAEMMGEGLNGPYVLTRMQGWIREQRYKSALVNANSRYEQGGDGLSDDIEGIFTSAIRYRTQTLDAGTFLSDTTRSLKFFDRDDSGISFGLPVFNKLGLYLRPKEMVLSIGPKGSGKSWGCTHVGTEALLQNERVVHIVLEMSEEQQAQRYYMRIFAAATREDKFKKSYLDFDEDLDDKLIGFRTRHVEPRWHFGDSNARRILTKKIKQWGTRFNRLVIKEFPSGQLTMQQLEAYLDYLELEKHFIPTVLIVDYPDLMAMDAKNLRISMGRTFVELRGLANRRNLKLYCPTQGNRSTIGGSRTKSGDVSEDISKVFTADVVLTYQQTEGEKELGLARIVVEHARGVPDGLTIVVTQSYATGQYMLQGARFQKVYNEKLQEALGQRERNEDDNDERSSRRQIGRNSPRALPPPDRDRR